ncbi:hypothetical protein Glove_91g42 [Diversispora epigaea]|uniref:Superoxide dismutase [Cu-Zn] n=1 Tax=Diversispora epigaea TaxID=1348612 RepID=A0A397JEG9_9GLOM|nr:hypothetical protein Glove_91g42 [Diversispora epigaea]
MNFFKIRHTLHLIFVLSLFISCFISISHQNKVNLGAVVVLMSNSLSQTQINGTINFTQLSLHKTRIDIYIEGLTPGLHGFHIHTFGDLTKRCESAGGHYNPFNLTHGASHDKVRHLGDLGNIRANVKGIVNTTIYDKLIKLSGPYSVIGRTVVVHGGKDDLGRGQNATSLTTGNSGARVACGIIGWRNMTQV